jgi:hypothetical protein
MEGYLTIKKNKIISFAGKWMEMEIIMLSEISQVKKGKYCRLSFIYGIQILKKDMFIKW